MIIIGLCFGVCGIVLRFQYECNMICIRIVQGLHYDCIMYSIYLLIIREKVETQIGSNEEKMKVENLV